MNIQPHNSENGEKKKYYKLIKYFGSSFTIGKIYEDRGNGWFWNDEGKSHGIVESILNKYFEIVNAYVPERTLTESETLKMLEALRQRCAEEAKDFAAYYNIRAIDLTQFLPPKP